MSTSLEESRWSADSCTGQSLTKLRDLPEAYITLRTVRWPAERTSNSASTTQVCAPSEITEASALAPKSSDRAPRSMDFPAPV